MILLQLAFIAVCSALSPTDIEKQAILRATYMLQTMGALGNSAAAVSAFHQQIAPSLAASLSTLGAQPANSNLVAAITKHYAQVLNSESLSETDILKRIMAESRPVPSRAFVPATVPDIENDYDMIEYRATRLADAYIRHGSVLAK